jgi:hypothetical protein
VQPGDTARVEDGAGARVAERRVLGDGALDEPDRLADPVLAGVAERLGDELGILDRARGERAGPGRDHGALCAARDRRCRVGDEDEAGCRSRLRHVDDLGLSAPQNNLFHSVESIGSEGRRTGPLSILWAHG